MHLHDVVEVRAGGHEGPCRVQFDLKLTVDLRGGHPMQACTRGRVVNANAAVRVRQAEQPAAVTEIPAIIIDVAFRKALDWLTTAHVPQLEAPGAAAHGEYPA